MQAAALYRAAQFGLTISPDCWTHLTDFIATGAKQVQSDDDLPDYLRVPAAEAAIILFVTRMIIEARLAGLDQLREPTFFGAKQRLCPLWPFC